MVNTLGLVVVASAGTNVQVAANRIGAQTIRLQVRPANTGMVYYGLPGMSKSTGVGVIGVLPVPAHATQGPFAAADISLPLQAAGLNVADLWLDTTVSGDGVFVSYTQG